MPETDSEKNDTPPESRNVDMAAIQLTSHRIAATDTTILILGESGVGKSRLARKIHQHSPRKNAPFVIVSCGSIPENLLESELFGVEKGAYTGALKSRPGRFQSSSGGTIFLDEVGELPGPLQVKLLRAIQEKRVEPIGSGKEIEVDVRIIAATNRDLETDVKSGRFREDLYYRLNVVPLTLPPLRKRREDIIPLARFFLSVFSHKFGRHFTLEDPALIHTLEKYNWPGNIRELENCIERLCVLSPDDILHMGDLPAAILETGPLPHTDNSGNRIPTLAEVEKIHILRALHSTDHNISRAAKLLGIHRNTLSRKIQDYQLLNSSYSDKSSQKNSH